MVFLFTPGKALGCTVNSHRHGWNGTVCSDAPNWNCSAPQGFRDDYCKNGDRRCYHVQMFDAQDPRMQIDDHGVGWILRVDPEALNDQILLIWGADFAEPSGIPEDRKHAILYGAYRIRSANKIELPYRRIWELEPYPDGWTRCHNLQIRKPPSRQLGGKYIREIDRNALRNAFAEGRRILDERREAGWFAAEDAGRFQRFGEKLDGWLDQAEKAAKARGYGERDVAPQPTERFRTGPASPPPLSRLKTMVTGLPVEASPPGTTAPASAAGRATPAQPPAASTPADPVLAPARLEAIAATYGNDTAQALRVGFGTKPILLLRGDTGVGKSYVALHLVDDPQRTLVVPVGATWRGREDLLGYVNPVSSAFEPTAFTRFLFDAAKAWKAGDKRPRLVVFEEFNLSQPEHWLADVLVVSQFEDEALRRIELGGHEVRGVPGAGDHVLLSPAVRFVATLNNDHTTRPLSPRVLDRAAVVELFLAAGDALDLVGPKLDDAQLVAIADLDDLLRPRAAAFSLRAARSLRTCLDPVGPLSLEPWQAIDLVLVQEVLSKVRLLARDPGDAELMAELVRWSERHGGELARCARTIEHWGETLDGGADVVQA